MAKKAQSNFQPPVDLGPFTFTTFYSEREHSRREFQKDKRVIDFAAQPACGCPAQFAASGAVLSYFGTSGAEVENIYKRHSFEPEERCASFKRQHTSGSPRAVSPSLSLHGPLSKTPTGTTNSELPASPRGRRTSRPSSSSGEPSLNTRLSTLSTSQSLRLSSGASTSGAGPAPSSSSRLRGHPPTSTNSPLSLEPQSGQDSLDAFSAEQCRVYTPVRTTPPAASVSGIGSGDALDEFERTANIGSRRQHLHTVPSAPVSLTMVQGNEVDSVDSLLHSISQPAAQPERVPVEQVGVFGCSTGPGSFVDKAKCLWAQVTQRRA